MNNTEEGRNCPVSAYYQEYVQKYAISFFECVGAHFLALLQRVSICAAFQGYFEFFTLLGYS